MTVLVTGATGFVMAHVVRQLAEAGHRVVAADRLAPDPRLARFFAGLPGAVEFRPLDVRDRDATARLVAEVAPTHAVLGAAITSVPPDAERSRFVDTVEVNVAGTLVGLDALRARGVPRCVVVSSGSVYGSRPDTTPVGEDAPTNPVGVYPLSKWAGEAFARRFAEVHGLDVRVVRLASPFGPFERDTGSRPLLSPLAYWARAAVNGQPLEVTGPDDFMRDAVYAPDVGRGIVAVLLAERVRSSIYNVGWGRGTTTGEAVATLGRLVPGLKVDRRPDAPSPWGHTVRGPLSIDRLRAELGWAPRFDLQSGLVAYLAWLREEAQPG